MHTMNKTPSNHQLIGRDTPLFMVSGKHVISGTSLFKPPENAEIAMFAMGCFWGVERLFWQQPGVISTMVGYSGGYTKNPTYEEVCTGNTEHAEVVKLYFDPTQLAYDKLLTLFWEKHNPTQGMRQGADVGSQYRSAIYTFSETQHHLAIESKSQYASALMNAQYQAIITTEITPASTFYFAEEYHQQYLHKNPNGYCQLAGIGICTI